MTFLLYNFQTFSLRARAHTPKGVFVIYDLGGRHFTPAPSQYQHDTLPSVNSNTHMTPSQENTQNVCDPPHILYKIQYSTSV
jgi:hypothetical protein